MISQTRTKRCNFASRIIRMKRQQILVAGTGVLLLLALYFFGQTVPPQSKVGAAVGGAPGSSLVKSIGLQEILQAYHARLTPGQQSYVNRLQNSVVRGDVAVHQLHPSRQLALFLTAPHPI